MPSIIHLAIVFFLIATISLSALSQASQESVITVGPQGCDFYRIEAALDSAGPGDIIEVQSGEYYVNLNITTPLITLRGIDTGNGKPILRAGSSTADIEDRGIGVTEMTVMTGGTAIAIREFGCIVDGFDITGVIPPVPYGSGEHNDLIGNAGIRVYSDGNTISNNTFYDNELTAIGLWNCSNNRIINNTIKDIPFGYAVELYNSNATTIEGNKLLHNHWGIEMQRSDSNTIEGNEITDSINDAIRAMKCNFTIISGNIITGSGWESEYEGNGKGISLMGSMSAITNNLIEFNRDDGIHIESIFWNNYPADESYDNFIHKNKIKRNGKDGISLVKSWENQLWDNNITANHGNGIGLTFSHNNTLELNNISQNQQGILLYQSNYTRIANSTIMDEVKGGIILDQYCTGNTLAFNIVSNSTEGINISGGSYSNAIFGNNLTSNVQPVWDIASNSWDKEGKGNYYGQPDCKDQDSDGICDLPYLIAGGTSVDHYPLVSWSRLPG
ncbi:MAG: right-handed parallel beta-helix repeat-containing protein [Methanothrix sp.]|nr:right-handed parallel beta-helix repeat-containing protein [Methanothrix sp.]MDD4446056.1 right-handed parallel beta-helix repeat-containing protein [Methanothrix sp.]